MAKGQAKIPRSFNQLTRRVVIGILLTGVIASLSTLVPLYFYVEKSTNNLALAYANAQAIAVQQQLEHYSSIAAQFSSRSHIRQQLYQYYLGNITKSQLTHDSQSRLEDASRLIPELIMGYRLDSKLQLISKYPGPADNNELPTDISLSELAGKPIYYVAHTTVDESNTSSETAIYISATSPVYDDEHQAIIGVDILLFNSFAIQGILRNLNQFGPETEFQLVNTRDRVYLKFNPHTQALEHDRLTEPQMLALAGYGDQAFVFHAQSNSDEGLSHYFVPFRDSQWGLIVTTPNQTLAYGLQSGLLWILGGILFSALVGAYLIRQWLQPIIRVQIERTMQLKDSNNKLVLANTVFEKTHEAIVITDAKLTIIRANSAVARLFDTDVAHLKSKSLLNFVDHEKVTTAMREDVTRHIRQHESWQGEVWYVRPTGSKFPALQTISPVRNSEGIATQLIHIFNDISSEKTAQKRIETLAMTDALTHLPNRFAIEHLLKEAIEKATADHTHDFAVLFIDLDKFKPVNDTYGHAVGDALLQAIGPRVKEALRANDVIGRLGGDEFVVIINQIKHRDDAGAIADKLLIALQKPFRIGEITVQVGASIGIAFYPGNGLTATALLSAADNAMYVAKQNGRQRYQIAPKE
ncbi:sensor domain-containing diguanylate cyclase [Pseudidiomarina woesei]|uniref:PAS domain S-box/diguanylate cyclase (GGDEF) domain n=1 Tax=Pseudidiomarina woesei TaxID=1381080 RepID=A0A0K6GVS1_9GAMM|nr:sensor domain-containing diguanylate cyclase [Pseudidiomarina woesei]CUA82670.1 PAS domain S-box/diguanylate cyclase (GGDEF) domain [Pseudidiomarina woesei]